MSMVQRLGWLLLGLLLLAGLMHAPLHQAGQDCGPFALCGNGVVLMSVSGWVILLMFFWRIQVRGIMQTQMPESTVVKNYCGRAPPRSR
ncbi:MAG: hypothetical protein QM477_03280 [Planctomycetota bacterium]